MSQGSTGEVLTLSGPSKSPAKLRTRSKPYNGKISLESEFNSGRELLL